MRETLAKHAFYSYSLLGGIADCNTSSFVLSTEQGKVLNFAKTVSHILHEHEGCQTQYHFAFSASHSEPRHR